MTTSSNGRAALSDFLGVLGRSPFGVLARAFGFSRDGLVNAFGSERAFRQEVILLACAVPLSFVLSADPYRRAELVASVIAVISVELLNTCAEKICDHVTPERHPSVKAVKDMGSAAVLCALAACAMLWIGAACSRFS